MPDREKHYAADPVKAKARDVLADMIERTLLTFRKPEQLQVLCFPGIDAAEVIQVYDRLGIPRANVTGLEREAKYIPHIKQAAPGIRVINETFEDYVASQDSLVYDVISTDYVGPMLDAQDQARSQLRNKMVRNHFVFHAANLVRRDHHSYGLYKSGNASRHAQQADIIDVALEGKGITHAVDGLMRQLNFSDKCESGGIDNEDRSQTYSMALLNSLKGVTLSDLSNVIELTLGNTYADVVAEIDEALEEIGIQRPEETNRFDFWTHYPFISEYIQVRSVESFHDRLKGRMPMSDARDISFWWDIFCEGVCDHRDFTLAAASRYNYISESGSPMMGDIFYLTYDEVLHGKARSIASVMERSLRGESSSIRFPEAKRLVKGYLRRLERITSLKQVNGVAGEFPKRIHLGNATKPLLTRQRAYACFEDGMSDDEIKEQFRISRKKNSLPAWRAWHTMRTREQTTQEASAPQRAKTLSLDDRIADDLTRGDLLELITSGVPEQEIAETYGIRSGTVRAVRAHHTMGRYDHLLADKLA